MPGRTETLKPAPAWFHGATDSDLEAITDGFDRLDAALKTATLERDHQQIAAAERASIIWKARVDRAHPDGLPEPFREAVERARQAVLQSVAEMAPIAAMRTLDEIAVDLLFVLQDSGEVELSTDHVLDRVLFGRKGAIDYVAYLDRLSAGGLVTPRHQLDLHLWRLSPFGLQTMTAIKEEVDREYSAFLAERDNGAALLAAVERNRHDIDEPQHALIPAFAAAALPWDGDGPLPHSAWFDTTIPAGEVRHARYETCVMISHVVGRCRPQQGGILAVLERADTAWRMLYKSYSRYVKRRAGPTDSTDQALRERVVSASG